MKKNILVNHPIYHPATEEEPEWWEDHWVAENVEMTPEEIEEMEREQAEEEARRRQEPPSELDKLSAQMLYTAVCTDSLIEEV